MPYLYMLQQPGDGGTRDCFVEDVHSVARFLAGAKPYPIVIQLCVQRIHSGRTRQITEWYACIKLKQHHSVNNIRALISGHTVSITL